MKYRHYNPNIQSNMQGQASSRSLAQNSTPVTAKMSSQSQAKAAQNSQPRSPAQSSAPSSQRTNSASNQAWNTNGHRHQSASNKKKTVNAKSFSSLLQGILPTSIYNPQSKKILGFLSAEDLLLIALIFLYAENDDEDNSLMILALVYVLISDYLDLPDFSF